jgi:chaperone BCS1
LANETNRHIININLNSDITKHQLDNLFFNESLIVVNSLTGQNEKYNIPLEQRIYVLEDIDCQGDMALKRTANISKDVNANNANDSNSSFEPLGSSGLNSKLNMCNLSDVNNSAKDSSDASTDKVDMSFILNILDGILEIPGRIVVMTSNHPELLDDALVRPGRIDLVSKFTKCVNQTIISMMEFSYNATLTQSQRKIILNMHDHQITPAEMSKITFENFGQLDATATTVQYLRDNYKNKNVIAMDVVDLHL